MKNRNALFFDAVSGAHIKTAEIVEFAYQDDVAAGNYKVDSSKISGWGKDYDGDNVRSYIFGNVEIILPKRFMTIEEYFGF